METVLDFTSDLSDLLDYAGNIIPEETLSIPVFPDTTPSPRYIPPSNFHKTSVRSQRHLTLPAFQNNVHTPPPFTKTSAIVARNNDTSIMCGCKGHFFWEFIPTQNLNFFRGSAPDVVDYCMSSVLVHANFNDAFWDAYTQCIEHTTRSSCFVSDYTLAVYQLHSVSTCPRHYTRYTLGSFKEFMGHNEQLRQAPVVGVFCKCIYNMEPADIAYNVCFTCLQTTLELHALSLEGIKRHFTYEVNFKDGFLGAVQNTMRNTREYFVAQALFESKIAKNVKSGNGYLNTWNSRGITWKTQRTLTKNKSYCIMCQKPGNSQDLFVCPNCTKL